LGLKDNTSDPRVIVWLAILLFIVGYAAWEFLLYLQAMSLSRESRKSLLLTAPATTLTHYRVKSHEICSARLLGSLIISTCVEDIDRSDLIRLDLGTGILSILSAHASCGLYGPAPS
jgi:hypothetical protein